MGQRFEWGDITADEYRQKRDSLLAQQAEIDAPAPASRMRFSGLLGAWDQADALGRRELLGALFVELDAREGKIWRGRPHPDVAAELWEHLKAWPLGWRTNSDGGFGESSPGGIRTRDLSLERAAS